MDFEYVEYPPSENLSSILRCSFFARGRIDYRSDRILPTGLIPVLFNIGNPHRVGKSAVPEQNAEFAHSWIDGFQTTPTYNTPIDGTHVLGLLFEPIGFHALFDVDMATLRDRTVDTRDVMSGEFVSQVEHLLPSASDRKTHAAIHLLVQEKSRKDLPDWLWSLYREILANRGTMELAAAYEHHGISTRHATAAFKKAIGVTPKRLCRIHRLLALLEEIEPKRQVNWTDLSHQFGFYDQAHFNHEFRHLAGSSPGEYLEQRRRDLPGLKKGENVPFAPER